MNNKTNQDRLKYIILMYDNSQVLPTIEELKILSSNDLELKHTYKCAPGAYVESSVDTFEKLFGTKPKYSEKDGWSFGEDISNKCYQDNNINKYHPNAHLKIPYQLRNQIQTVEMDYKIKTSQAKPEVLFNLLVIKS